MNGMLRASLGTRGSPLPLTVAPVGEWCDLSEVPRADYRGCQSGRPFSRKGAQVAVHLLVHQQDGNELFFMSTFL